MPDCSSAVIQIGGTLDPDELDEFIDATCEVETVYVGNKEIEDTGELVRLLERGEAVAVEFSDGDASGGQFETLEAFCQANGLLYRRITDGSAFIDPAYVVFDGSGEREYAQSNNSLLVPIAVLTDPSRKADLEDAIADDAFEVPPLKLAGRDGRRPS